MMKNHKAISTLAAVFILCILIASVVGLALMLGGSSPSSNPDITVYIDGAKQTGNYSQPQTLNWGSVSALNTYTKTFNVTNTGTQTYNLILITSEPAGSTQTWAYNNTKLNSMSYASSTLSLTLDAEPTAGPYTWKLLTSNSTAPTPTPTVNPSETPAPTNTPAPTATPNNLQFTIHLQGVDTFGSFNVTIGSAKIPLLPSDFNPSYTLKFTSGATLIFQIEVPADYQFIRWDFSNNNPDTHNPLSLTNVSESFEITAVIQPNT